eukprot:scaffold23572_cov49-Phaeocystis_antarctica.AAC.1
MKLRTCYEGAAKEPRTLRNCGGARFHPRFCLDRPLSSWTRLLRRCHEGVTMRTDEGNAEALGFHPRFRLHRLRSFIKP